MHKTWTREELFDAVTHWLKTHGELPNSADWTFSGGDEYPTYQTIWTRFGSWEEFIRKYRIFDREWDQEKIIAVFQEWNEIYGTPPTVAAARTEAGIWLPRPSTVVTYFGSWNNAISAAGFVPMLPGVTRKNVSKFMPMPKKS